MTSNQVLGTMLLAAEQPRAVSIVLGHLGVNARTLARYGKYYADRQCSVVTASSPVPRFVLNSSLRPTAREILTQVATAVKDTPATVPVVVHLFSNGGAFLLEQMEDILQTEPSAENALIASRLQKGFQFFDSCPCYLRLVWDTPHLAASFPNPSWSSLGRAVYATASAATLTLWCTATLSWHRPHQFWNRLQNSQMCRHQVFVYTTSDMLSDASAADRFIEGRKEQGVDCTVYRYDDSDHCRLDKDHPDEYGRAIDDALDAAIQRCNQTGDGSAQDS